MKRSRLIWLKCRSEVKGLPYLTPVLTAAPTASEEHFENPLVLQMRKLRLKKVKIS